MAFSLPFTSKTTLILTRRDCLFYSLNSNFLHNIKNFSLYYPTVAEIRIFIGPAPALNVDNLFITLSLDRSALSFIQRINCIKQAIQEHILTESILSIPSCYTARSVCSLAIRPRTPSLHENAPELCGIRG